MHDEVGGTSGKVLFFLIWSLLLFSLVVVVFVGDVALGVHYCFVLIVHVAMEDGAVLYVAVVEPRPA